MTIVGLPVRLCRRCCFGRTTRQQCLWSQPVAVVVWARQAPPWRPVYRADCGEEGRHEQCTAQAGSRDKTGSQDGLSLIPSKGWYISVCTELYVVNTGIYTYVLSLHTWLSARVFFFTFGCRICCAVHGVCMLAWPNINTLPYRKKITDLSWAMWKHAT